MVESQSLGQGIALLYTQARITFQSKFTPNVPLKIVKSRLNRLILSLVDHDLFRLARNLEHGMPTQVANEQRPRYAILRRRRKLDLDTQR